MNRSIKLYRFIAAAWFALFLAASYLAVVGSSSAALACAIGVAFLIVVQTFAFRCKACGARPGLWLLAIWTLLLDYELYIADVILLRRCPKCESVFKHAERDATA